MSGPEFEIFVNNRRVTTTEAQLTGAQIKQLASVPLDYELYLVHGNESQAILDNQIVAIKNGEHFRAIPAGTFGEKYAAT